MRVKSVSNAFQDFAISGVVIALFVLGVWLIPMGATVPEPFAHVAVLDAHSGDEAGVTDGSRDAFFAALPRSAVIRLPARPVWLRISVDKAWDNVDSPTLALRNYGLQGASLYGDGALLGAVGSSADKGGARFARLDAYFRLPAHIPAHLYLLMDAAKPRSVMLELLPTEKLHVEELWQTRLLVTCINLLFAMALVGVIFWQAIRTPVFAYYAWLAFSMALYLAFVSGEGFHLPFGHIARAHRDIFIVVAGVGASIASIKIIQALLPRAPSVFRMRRVFDVTVLVWCFIGVCIVAAPSSMLDGFKLAGNILFLLAVCFLLMATVPAAVGGSRPARLTLVGWLLLWFFTAAKVLEMIQWKKSELVDVAFPLSTLLGALMPALALADFWAQDRKELMKAVEAAEIDGLTKIFNRKTIEHRLAVAFAHARATGQDLAILFVDIDHFKSINDRYGHAAGDNCIGAGAAAINGFLRPGDKVGRWGGEEFVVVLAAANTGDAVAVAERIRAGISLLEIVAGNHTIKITASFGVAVLEDAIASPSEFVAIADAALYEAKREGRNKVVLGQLPVNMENLDDSNAYIDRRAAR
jgi:diguanylate cyclase (GGDEF)-like protein